MALSFNCISLWTASRWEIPTSLKHIYMMIIDENHTPETIYQFVQNVDPPLICSKIQIPTWPRFFSTSTTSVSTTTSSPSCGGGLWGLPGPPRFSNCIFKRVISSWNSRILSLANSAGGMDPGFCRGVAYGHRMPVERMCSCKIIDSTLRNTCTKYEPSLLSMGWIVPQ